MSESNNNEEKNLNIAVNHKYFTTSLLEILNMVKSKSEELNLNNLDQNDKQQKKLFNGHTKLRNACDELKKGFTDSVDYDQGRIIKKIYKVITQYLDNLYPNPSKDLFSIKNKENATVTIIPGLDIQLVTKMMDDDEMKKLWDYMYMLYISSVVMITEINSHKKDGKVWEVLPKMNDLLIKSGKYEFNPFIGVNTLGKTSDDKNVTSNYSMETMFENVEDYEKPTGPSIEDMFDLAGVDKMIDLKQLNEQLKNVKREDIEDATKNITKLLGAEDDPDVKETVQTLVGGIVDDLKTNPADGIKGMVKVAKEVAEKYGKKIDKSKMEKTASQLGDFLKNGEKNLKNMKDEHGNPIGEQLMESLKGPLEMAQMSGKNGQMPNMADMAGLMAQVTSAVGKIQNQNKNQPKKSKPKNK